MAWDNGLYANAEPLNIDIANKITHVLPTDLLWNSFHLLKAQYN